MFSTTDTIVAIATPPGRGGIGVVRLAGPSAPAIAATLLGRSAPLEPRHATFGRITDRAAADADRPVDQVVATSFPAPHSYTGDDVVEISGHGSPLLLQRIVELAMAEGARLAEPGEFTFRAYLNGRLDLVQAEAIADLVNAVTPLQARAAMDQLEGTLTIAIGRVDAALFDLSARLEASLDFPDEGFHFVTREQMAVELGAVAEDLRALVRDGEAGRVVRDGSLVVITGRPNAGKSSLFNTLVGAARAIVTEVPGTTRDVITERVDIGGLAVTLVDTAGMREAADAVEREGVRRAQQARAIAAVTIVVLDGSEPLTGDAEREDERMSGPQIVVVSKSDLERPWPLTALGARAAIEVSVVSGAGIETLRRAIVAALTSREEWRDPPAISNVRHLRLVEDALSAVLRARESVDAGATEELILAELGAAREALEAITGRRAPDELLRHIFERFCIGK